MSQERLDPTAGMRQQRRQSAAPAQERGSSSTFSTTSGTPHSRRSCWSFWGAVSGAHPLSRDCGSAGHRPACPGEPMSAWQCAITLSSRTCIHPGPEGRVGWATPGPGSTQCHQGRVGRAATGPGKVQGRCGKRQPWTGRSLPALVGMRGGQGGCWGSGTNCGHRNGSLCHHVSAISSPARGPWGSAAPLSCWALPSSCWPPAAPR